MDLLERMGIVIKEATPERVVAVIERLGLSARYADGTPSGTGPDAAARVPELLAALGAAGIRVAGVDVERASLEDVFVALTERGVA